MYSAAAINSATGAIARLRFNKTQVARPAVDSPTAFRSS